MVVTVSGGGGGGGGGSCSGNGGGVYEEELIGRAKRYCRRKVVRTPYLCCLVLVCFKVKLPEKV